MSNVGFDAKGSREPEWQRGQFAANEECVGVPDAGHAGVCRSHAHSSPHLCSIVHRNLQVTVCATAHIVNAKVDMSARRAYAPQATGNDALRSIAVQWISTVATSEGVPRDYLAEPVARMFPAAW